LSNSESGKLDSDSGHRRRADEAQDPHMEDTLHEAQRRFKKTYEAAMTRARRGTPNEPND